jgi:hypothetical protein|tara:strand:+ start:5614 stop:6543 length:930 start_codon:yes stop_codon:yes gene_type:complete
MSDKDKIKEGIKNLSKYYSEPNFKVNESLWKFCPSDHLLHIHIPKCAGTWLKQIVYNSPSGTHRFNHGHLPAAIQRLMLEDRGYKWDQFKPWAIVRNPWDRLWSAYKYTKWGGVEVNLRPVAETRGKFELKSKNYITNSKLYVPYTEKLPIHHFHLDTLYSWEEESTEKVELGWLKNQNIGKDFKEYVTTLWKKIPSNKIKKEDKKPWFRQIEKNIYLDPQMTFLRDKIDFGEVIVPHIFRHNEIKKFLKWAESQSKDKFITKRTNQKKSYNTSINRIHYFNVYDDDMINMVGDLYKEDIDYLNYSFEE